MRDLTPIVLLTTIATATAAAVPAPAHAEDVARTCPVVASVEVKGELPEGWEAQLAAQLREKGQRVEGACVRVREGDAVRTGHLVRDDSGGFRFDKGQIAAAEDIRHIQFHGSDFNAAR